MSVACYKNSTQLFTNLQNFATTIQIFIILYKTLQNYTQLHNSPQHYRKLYKTLHNYTQLHKCGQNAKNFYKTFFTTLYTTLQKQHTFKTFTKFTKL